MSKYLYVVSLERNKKIFLFQPLIFNTYTNVNYIVIEVKIFTQWFCNVSMKNQDRYKNI